MFALIQILFLGHVHKWKIIEERLVSKNRESMPHGIVRTLQCEHCGNLKTHSLLSSDL